MIERRVFLLGLDVNQHRVALVERAALAVLPGEPHRRPSRQQAAERQRLGHPVVEPPLAFGHLDPLFEQLLHLGVNVEALGPGGESGHQRSKFFDRRARLDFVRGIVAAAKVRRPVRRQRGERHALGDRFRLLLGGAVIRADTSGHGLAIEAGARREHLPQRRMILDRLVHPGLRDRRVVDFAVTVAPIADDVDHHIAVEHVAELDGEACHAHDRGQVLAIHVEDGNRQPLGHVGRERRRVQFAIGCGESEQVVVDDVNRAANRVAGQAREVQPFGRDALAGKRTVTVQHDRHDARARPLALARLPRACPPDGHRKHRFEVTRIRHQLRAQVAPAAGSVRAGGTHVVFDVAAAEHALGIRILEAGVEVPDRPPDDVGHHVQTTTMAHPDERLVETISSGRFEHFVEERNQRRHALEREPLGPGIPTVQDLLEQVGANEPLEHRRRVDVRCRLLHALRDPPAARRIGDVHELDANRAAVPLTTAIGGSARHPRVRDETAAA